MTSYMAKRHIHIIYAIYPMYLPNCCNCVVWLRLSQKEIAPEYINIFQIIILFLLTMTWFFFRIIGIPVRTKCTPLIDICFYMIWTFTKWHFKKDLDISFSSQNTRLRQKKIVQLSFFMVTFLWIPLSQIIDKVYCLKGNIVYKHNSTCRHI